MQIDGNGECVDGYTLHEVVLAPTFNSLSTSYAATRVYIKQQWKWRGGGDETGGPKPTGRVEPDF